MNHLPLLLQAAVIGFAIAVPLGPIGLMCVERTLAKGFWAGFSTGFGVSLADAIWCAVVAFGAVWISDSLNSHQHSLRIAGGVVIAGLGLRTLLQGAKAPRPLRSSLSGGAFVSAFGITLLNPMTFITFAAIFAGLGAAEPNRVEAGGGMVVAGIFIGSLTWWTSLSLGVSWLPHQLRPSTVLWMNRIAGAGLIVFGLVVIATAGVDLQI